MNVDFSVKPALRGKEDLPASWLKRGMTRTEDGAQVAAVGLDSNIATIAWRRGEETQVTIYNKTEKVQVYV